MKKLNKKDVQLIIVIIIGIVAWFGIMYNMIIDKVWTW